MTKNLHPDNYLIPNKQLSIPIKQGGNLIKFSIFEIGCSFDEKPSQMRGIIGTLNSYNKRGFYISSECFPTIISYREIPNGSLRSFTVLRLNSFPQWTIPYLERKILYNDKINQRINLRNREQAILEEIICENDLDKLNNLILDKGRATKYSGVRGMVVESVAQEIIKKTAPNEVRILYNGNLFSFFKNIGRESKINPEIDALGIFYKTKLYIEHISNMEQLECIEIKRVSNRIKKLM